MDLDKLPEDILKKGVYKHFKGTEYEVLYLGRHSEDLSIMVIYKDLNNLRIWVRPLEEFNKPLPDGGKRFIFIED
jgi:hypothetical protein